MNIEDLSLEWNVSKMCVLQLATGEGDLCAGDVGIICRGSYLFSVFPWWIFDFTVEYSSFLPSGLSLFLLTEWLKKWTQTQKKRNLFWSSKRNCSQQLQLPCRQSRGEYGISLPGCGPLLRKMALKPIVQALQYLMGVCFLEGFSGSKTRPGRCDDLGWREATREFQWLTS